MPPPEGSWDLSFLGTQPLEEARDWLVSLPGIGRKTASIILLFGFGRPAVPVDTHVHRVATRMGCCLRAPRSIEPTICWRRCCTPRRCTRFTSS